LIHPREVARLLTVREWLLLCDQVDAKFGRNRKFDVNEVERGEDLRVTVAVEGVACSAQFSYAAKEAA
jgi:hypothetical protein